MVFFNCNACGDALKKNQVEKHVLRCRNCQVLSCVDCGKDFWGNDYQTHTKCMTEEEKYCGQNYVKKVNKGEAKQEQWIEKVQAAIDKSASDPGLERLLIRLKDYPNIPRKESKFRNFLQNSLRIYSNYQITQVWEVLMAQAPQEQKSENVGNGVSNPKEETSIPQENGNHATAPENGQATSNEVTEKKKSKREKKEERSNKSNKKEKKDKVELGENGENVKKNKKRKHRDEEEEEEETTKENGSASTEEPERKKKKKKHASKEESEEEPVVAAEDEENKKVKFDWERTIIKVLKDKGEISLKRLRKKVLGEFAALDAANYSEENLCAKFSKKVKKMPNVQISKDRAKFIKRK